MVDSDVIRADRRYNLTSNDGIGVHPTMDPTVRIGRVIAETVGMQQTMTPAMRYSWTVAEQLHMRAALLAGVPVKLSDGIGVHPAQTISLAVTILQALGIAASPLPSLRYTQTLVQGIGMSSAFRNFFGAALSDGIGVHESLARQFRASPTLADGIGIHEALSNHFYIRVTLSDRIHVDDSDTLKMIYDGRLADGIEVVAGYVSPDGQFTTWAINTRTGATTEYSNYVFNSFAQISDVYYGASSSGLYKLIGDNDAGANIVATIKSGFAQWAGSRFSLLKGAYLGARGGGTYVLKIITGDNKTYVYQVATRDQRTTKVHLGKGLRARYLAFELISAGQDFDLDTIEFVPLMSERRV